MLRLIEVQISAKMGKMKSGTGKERHHSKKPKKAEIVGKNGEKRDWMLKKKSKI